MRMPTAGVKGSGPAPRFQGGLQVQIVAGGAVGVDTLHSPAAEHHHGDAGRHSQRLLRAGEHHVGAPTLHADVIGQKCTDGIHHQYQTVFTAESGDHVHIVQNAGGRLVHIHQKARVALSGIGGQIGGVRAWPCRSSMAVWGCRRPRRSRRSGDRSCRRPPPAAGRPW